MLANVNDMAAGHEIIHNLRNLALDNDFAAQFAAGVAYGISGRTEDIRDYLVDDCMKDNNPLTRKLNRAFERYNDGKIKAGTMILQRAETNFNKAMEDCPDTMALFDQIWLDFNAFLDREDYEDIAMANYLENQAFVDSWWVNCLATWSWGVEFNAGMFLGEIYNVLAVVPAPPSW